MSHADIGMAKYVQERFPISLGMLHALKMYLCQCRWREVEPSVFIVPLDGGVRVDVPADPASPDVISAAQAVAEIFELLAMQLHITLDEAIDRVQQIFDNQQQGAFQTAGHGTVVSDDGVVVYETGRLDPNDPDDVPGLDEMLLLDPLEAVQIAQHVLTHQGRLVAMHERLEATFEELSEELLAELLKGKDRGAFSRLLWDGDVQNAYTSLFVRDGTKIQAWRRASFKGGRFSHDLQEQLFLRYFNRRYKAQIFPQVERTGQEENDAEETD